MLAASEMTDHRHTLSLLDKLTLWVGWAAAGGIFFTLGWMAMAPDDPLGAVSLLMRRSAPAMWLQAAGLAAVVSAVATVLIGRSVPYAGPFAAAVGLVVVSLRGEHADALLLAAQARQTSMSLLAVEMALEAMAWSVVMVIAYWVGTAVERWCTNGNWKRDLMAFHPADTRQGLLFVVTALGIALVAYSILGAGMTSRAIRHSQVCFVVGGSVWLGSYVAHRVLRVRTVFWSLAVVVVLAIGGYLWAALRPVPRDLPPSVPGSNFLRVLPIQFVAMGVAGAIAAYWSYVRHMHYSSEEEAPPE